MTTLSYFNTTMVTTKRADEVIDYLWEKDFNTTMVTTKRLSWRCSTARESYFNTTIVTTKPVCEHQSFQAFSLYQKPK
jgi:hypothetical protein